LLERADAVGLRPRVALLAIVGRGLDAPVLYRSGQARRADAQTRRRPDALVHRRASRMRARGLGQRLIGLERQGRDERRVVEQAVLGVQNDVRRERARAEAGELGGVHHRHRRLVAVDRQGRRLKRLVRQSALDEVAHRMDGHVFAQVLAGNLHHAVVGAAPRDGGGPVAAGDHHAARARQDVLRAIALGHLLAERFDRRDTDHARAGLEADGFHLLLPGHESLRIIPSGPVLRAQMRAACAVVLTRPGRRWVIVGAWTMTGPAMPARIAAGLLAVVIPVSGCAQRGSFSWSRIDTVLSSRRTRAEYAAEAKKNTHPAEAVKRGFGTTLGASMAGG